MRARTARRAAAAVGRVRTGSGGGGGRGAAAAAAVRRRGGRRRRRGRLRRGGGGGAGGNRGGGLNRRSPVAQEARGFAAALARGQDSEQDGATAQPHRWRWRGTKFVLWFVDGLSAVPCSVQQRCALTKTTCTQDKTPRPAALQRSRSAARSQKKHALPTPSLRLLHPSPGDHQCTFYFPHTIPGSHPHHAP